MKVFFILALALYFLKNCRRGAQIDPKNCPPPPLKEVSVRTPKNQKNLHFSMVFCYFHKPVVARTGSAGSKTRVMESCVK